MTNRRTSISIGALSLLAAACAALAALVYWQDNAIAMRGVQAEAIVTGMGEQEVGYHFLLEGRRPAPAFQEARQVVSRGFYASVAPGDRVPVWYLLEDPSRSVIDTSPAGDLMLGAIAAAVLFAVLAVVLHARRRAVAEGKEAGIHRSGEQRLKPLSDLS